MSALGQTRTIRACPLHVCFTFNRGQSGARQRCREGLLLPFSNSPLSTRPASRCTRVRVLPVSDKVDFRTCLGRHTRFRRQLSAETKSAEFWPAMARSKHLGQSALLPKSTIYFAWPALGGVLNFRRPRALRLIVKLPELLSDRCGILGGGGNEG